MEKQSITALMSCFGRAYHAENERHPVFRDTLAKQLLTQADKKRRIERAGWPAAENLTFVPADLAADDLAQRLDTAGFARGERAFFSWLGVTYYLTEEAIGRALDALAALCAPGSLLAFDYPDEGFFTASERRVQCTVRMAAGGEPMRSSFSRAALEELLAAHGFRIRELLTPADIQKNTIDAAGAELTAFEHVNYCLAARED